MCKLSQLIYIVKYKADGTINLSKINGKIIHLNL